MVSMSTTPREPPDTLETPSKAQQMAPLEMPLAPLGKVDVQFCRLIRL